MGMLEELVETRFVSDEEQLRDLVQGFDRRKADVEWHEAQIAFADVSGRLETARTVDRQLQCEWEAASKRLFSLFSEGCTEEKWLFVAWWSYKQRLTRHHRRES